MMTSDKKYDVWRISRLAALMIIFSWLFVGLSYAQESKNTLEDDLVVLSQLSQANQTSKNQATATAQDQNTSNQTPKTSSAKAIESDSLILNQPIIDEAHILTDSEKKRLSSQLLKIYEDKLAQMAVVIVPTTDGVNIFDYALATAKRWQLGDKDKDDGILMLIAINDRQIYILTGYGVEGVLPDVVVKRIIRNQITPAFQEGRYSKGISDAIEVIDQRLRSDPETLARADETDRAADPDVGTFVLFSLFFGLFFGSILTRLFGRLLGSVLNSIGIMLIGLSLGMGLIISIFVALILWFFVLFNSVFRGFGGNFPSGGSGGGFFGGGSSTGGFGGGSSGYSGGGGSFGGGGAGGSW